ncbi:MAG: hypothetical protein WCG15_00640 [Actinomycetes bacterium]
MPSNPTPDEMRLALAQQNRVAVPNRPGRTMPADQASIAYAMTHGLAPMLFGAAKGTVATIPGVVGDVNELLRDYAVPYLPTGVQQALAKAPAPYTTEQYVNMMPKMGGHTEDVATKLGSNIVGAVVDPFAVVGAVKRAPAAGRALAETAGQRIMQGQSLIPGVPASITNPPMMFAVKPEKGGNWLNNSIENSVGGLRYAGKPIDTSRKLTQEAGNAIRYDYPNIDEGYAEHFRGTGKHSMEYADDYWDWMAKNHPKEFAEVSEGRTPSHYLNNFVDKKIVPYIKNNMATPHDPVRELADRGVSHMPLYQEPVVTGDTYARRERAGLPKEGFARTPLGQQWEHKADESILGKSAGMHVKQGELPDAFDTTRWNLQRNPWLKDVPPETTVYQMGSSDRITNLGFDHVMDELRNAISPNSGLPDNLRLKPEALDKVTLPQAIERVSKINDWRSAEAAKAEKAGMLENLNAAPRLDVPEAKLSFVDNPGMKWVDIPETTEKKGLDLCTTIGKQGGWCTQGENLAEHYGSGENRLTALLDSEGRPHAQAKITQQSPEMHKADFLGSLTQEQYDRVLNNNGPVATQMYEDWAKRNPIKQNITELKPVGNDFGSARAREYEKRDPRYQQVVQQGVLDFLNKGDWGKVRDLDHYDIYDLADPKSLNRGLEDVLGDYHLSHERASIFNAAVSETPDANRFMNRSQLQQFVSPYSIEPNAKPEGYKDGGGVSAVESGDPSIQFYSRTMENPDKSKMTETGIAKQFEEDYMRFAVQRHEQAKRQDIPNPPAPATRTNVYGEYGTPMMGGMVSGRVTKLNDQPDTYMGDLAYRTNIGPGMAHLGVQGMRTPQMPAQVTGYNAGYNLPLGGNGFAGVNVMQPAQGGKPVLGAQVQYRKSFAKGGAVRSLETNLPALPKTDYHSIDELMAHISKEHKIAPQKLHDDFVAKHRMTPDTWIKRK